jgi:long-chain acyl-CoA synthetase
MSKEYKYNTLYQMLEDKAQEHPKRVAIFCQKSKIEYSKLKNYADSIATYLATFGIKPGDKVGLFMHNGWEFIATVFAISKVGAVFVPINTFIKSCELSFILKDSDIKLIFASDELLNIVKGSIIAVNLDKVVWVGDGDIGTRFNDISNLKNEVREFKRDLEDTAAIFYTSGTTGRPKGAVVTNKALISNATVASEHLKLTKRDRILLVLPIFHTYPFNTSLVVPIFAGSAIVVLKQLRPLERLFKEIILKKITILVGVPEVYNTIISKKLSWSFKTLNHIRLILSGSSSLRANTLVKLKKKFPRAKIIEGYGLTEATAFVSANPLDRQKVGSVGIPSKICKLKIINNNRIVKINEIGEIIVKGDNVITSYLNNDYSNIKNGWLYTGDMGYIDKDNFLYLIGRKSDIIISKGFNIYPKEIEDVLNKYPGVIKSAVIGESDKIFGEVPVAFLEVEDMQISIDKLKAYANGFLASYKVPKEFYIIDKIPVTVTGKTVRGQLADMLKKIKGKD